MNSDFVTRRSFNDESFVVVHTGLLDLTARCEYIYCRRRLMPYGELEVYIRFAVSKIDNNFWLFQIFLCLAYLLIG